MNKTLFLIAGAMLLSHPIDRAIATEPPAFAGNWMTVAGPGAVRLLDWQTSMPASWIAQAPSSNFRLAQFQVPGPSGSTAAEMAIFYFGPGQGGAVQPNIERWRSQFSRPDGKPVEPVVKTERVSSLEVTHVELSGTYARGMGVGSTDAARPNQMLLASIVETPKGNLTFQLWGPRETVIANRNGFLAAVRGLHP